MQHWDQHVVPGDENAQTDRRALQKHLDLMHAPQVALAANPRERQCSTRQQIDGAPATIVMAGAPLLAGLLKFEASL